MNDMCSVKRCVDIQKKDSIQSHQPGTYRGWRCTWYFTPLGDNGARVGTRYSASLLPHKPQQINQKQSGSGLSGRKSSIKQSINNTSCTQKYNQIHAKHSPSPSNDDNLADILFPSPGNALNPPSKQAHANLHPVRASHVDAPSSISLAQLISIQASSLPIFTWKSPGPLVSSRLIHFIQFFPHSPCRSPFRWSNAHLPIHGTFARCHQVPRAPSPCPPSSIQLACSVHAATAAYLVVLASGDRVPRDRLHLTGPPFSSSSCGSLHPALSARRLSGRPASEWRRAVQTCTTTAHSCRFGMAWRPENAGSGQAGPRGSTGPAWEEGPLATEKMLRERGEGPPPLG